MKITIEIDNTDELVACLTKIIELLGGAGAATSKEDIFVSGPSLKYCKGCNNQFAFENEKTLYCSTCKLKRAKNLKELTKLNPKLRKGEKVKQWKTFKCKTCGVEFKKQAHYALYCSKCRAKGSKKVSKTPLKGITRKGRGRPKKVKSTENENIKKAKDDGFNLIYDTNGAVIGSTNYPPVPISNKHPAAININERIEEGEFGEVTV